MNEIVVSVQNLKKYYPDVKAVDDISFSIMEKEIFGIIGPNGAGKTTAIECMAGMKAFNGGKIDILGLDVVKNGAKLKNRIGLQQQESEIPERLRLKDAMLLFSAFYDSVLDWQKLLKDLNLWDKREAMYSSLSGGQKKRFFVAMALLGDPEIVFLDELTSGLDPQSRRSVWSLIKNLREQGRTIVLSTHYMDEAENLCDRVAIIDKGKLFALDSPENLILQYGGFTRVQFRISEPFESNVLCNLDGVENISFKEDICFVNISDKSAIVKIVKYLDKIKQGLEYFTITSPSLEDVFLNITGREVRS